MGETMGGTLMCLLTASALLMVGCISSRDSGDWPTPPPQTLDIQALIDAASDESEVSIPFGEYTLLKGLQIKNKKNLTLTSRPGTRVLVIDTDADVISVENSEGTRIENMHLSHLQPLEEYNCHGAVVRVADSTGTGILNCELNGCGAVGVSAWNSNITLIRNCLIHHNTFNAFYFESCNDVTIQSNIVENNGNFIQMYRSESLEMRDNIIRHNGGYWTSPPDPSPGLKTNPGKIEEQARE